MSHESSLGIDSRLGARSLGVFRGHAATKLGVTRNQLTALIAAGAIERVLPDTYRMCVVAPSHVQSLRAALLWAGTGAAGAGVSAVQVYGLEGVRQRRARLRRTDAPRPRQPQVAQDHGHALRRPCLPRRHRHRRHRIRLLGDRHRPRGHVRFLRYAADRTVHRVRPLDCSIRSQLDRAGRGSQSTAMRRASWARPGARRSAATAGS